MAGTGKKWMIGCGIGCGLALLIVGGLGTAVYFGVRDIAGHAETVEDSFENMAAAYGRVEDYTPPADGVVTAPRLETFLAVRDQMTSTRRTLSEQLAALGGGKGAAGPADWWTKIKAGATFVPSLLAYGAERNEVLLANDMSLGEYLYIYVLAYYVYLERNPGDGPSFRMIDSRDDGDHGFRIERRDSDPEDVRRQRENHIRESVHRLLDEMARNQLAALDQAEASLPGSQPAAWRATLLAELERMDAERRRLLWEDGLPERMSATFAAYRDRLAEVYDPMVNVIEAGLTGVD